MFIAFLLLTLLIFVVLESFLFITNSPTIDIDFRVTFNYTLITENMTDISMMGFTLMLPLIIMPMSLLLSAGNS